MVRPRKTRTTLRSVQAASVTSYSIATNLISDLRNTACGREICSPGHTFMDFRLVGLCHCFGSIATRQSWPHTSGTFSVSGLALAGAGLIVAGRAPENVVTQYPPGRSTDMRDGPRRLPLIALGALGALIAL